MLTTFDASYNGAIRHAAGRLRRGGVVIYPTETFFAIGCRIDCPQAIERIFRLKKRRHQAALPVLISSCEQLSAITQDHARDAETMDALRTLWPAPLTLLLEAKPGIPAMLTAGTGRIAVRISPHPVASLLTELCGCPLVCTSANISGMPPSTHAGGISRELLNALDAAGDALLDMPPRPSGGLPSTIVEPCDPMTLRMIRQGAFDMERLKKLGFRIITQEAGE